MTDVQWTREGVVSLERRLDSDVLTQLDAEAQSCAPGIRGGVSEVEIRRDGSFATPSAYSVHRGGPVLTGLQRDMDLLEEIRSVTGIARLVPVRCSYNFYAPGDYMGVHRDEIRATVTATFTLTESLPPTRYVACSRDWTNDELAEFVTERGHLPESGDDMPLALGTLNLFDGYNLAHWRPPVESHAVLANLVYFRL